MFDVSALTRGVRVGVDFDGTLIDSSVALRVAYATAGVEWRPNVPWREWCTPSQHAVKTAAYPGLLREHGRLLPLGKLALENPTWLVLTGASRASWEAAHVFGFQNVALTGLSGEEKLAAISWHGVSLYFDDDLPTVRLISMELPECQVHHVRWL